MISTMPSVTITTTAYGEPGRDCHELEAFPPDDGWSVGRARVFVRFLDSKSMLTEWLLPRFLLVILSLLLVVSFYMSILLFVKVTGYGRFECDLSDLA